MHHLRTDRHAERHDVQRHRLDRVDSYNYRVLATDAAGNLSAYSNTATATTPTPDTTAPTAPTV